MTEITSQQTTAAQAEPPAKVEASGSKSFTQEIHRQARDFIAVLGKLPITELRSVVETIYAQRLRLEPETELRDLIRSNQSDPAAAVAILKILDAHLAKESSLSSYFALLANVTKTELYPLLKTSFKKAHPDSTETEIESSVVKLIVGSEVIRSAEWVIQALKEEATQTVLSHFAKRRISFLSDPAYFLDNYARDFLPESSSESDSSSKNETWIPNESGLSIVEAFYDSLGVKGVKDFKVVERIMRAASSPIRYLGASCFKLEPDRDRVADIFSELTRSTALIAAAGLMVRDNADVKAILDLNESDLAHLRDRALLDAIPNALIQLPILAEHIRDNSLQKYVGTDGLLSKLHALRENLLPDLDFDGANRTFKRYFGRSFDSFLKDLGTLPSLFSSSVSISQLEQDGQFSQFVDSWGSAHGADPRNFTTRQIQECLENYSVIFRPSPLKALERALLQGLHRNGIVSVIPDRESDPITGRQIFHPPLSPAEQQAIQNVEPEKLLQALGRTAEMFRNEYGIQIQQFTAVLRATIDPDINRALNDPEVQKMYRSSMRLLLGAEPNLRELSDLSSLINLIPLADELRANPEAAKIYSFNKDGEALWDFAKYLDRNKDNRQLALQVFERLSKVSKRDAAIVLQGVKTLDPENLTTLSVALNDSERLDLIEKLFADGSPGESLTREIETILVGSKQALNTEIATIHSSRDFLNGKLRKVAGELRNLGFSITLEQEQVLQKLFSQYSNSPDRWNLEFGLHEISRNLALSNEVRDLGSKDGTVEQLLTLFRIRKTIADIEGKSWVGSPSE